MKVSQVARNLGVSPDTIRYYTRIGLLHPNYSSNGYKSYSAKDVSRLRFVLRAKMLGFSLADIKSIFEISERGDLPPLNESSLIERNPLN